MGRTLLSPQRLSGTKETNIGRIIIFCEGATEKHYFDYFAEILKKNKYNSIEVILETVNGNAQTVLKHADRFMSNEENRHKFSAYGKYLAFDCDDPPDIQSVVMSAKEYELLVSNNLFEIWLLMHFEDVVVKLTKRQIESKLSMHLHSGYSKGNKGIIREIIQNGDIEKAIDNAKELEQRYADEEKDLLINIKDMNPYTSVHSLIEMFMRAVTE